MSVLVTPAYAAQARDRLGRDRTLAVEQFAVLETDPQRARTIARGPLGFMGQVPAYQASFRRMDFTQEEIDQRTDRLVDALVAWGDPASIAARITEQLEAGADHVLISLVTDTADAQSVEPWRQLAEHQLVRPPQNTRPERPSRRQRYEYGTALPRARMRPDRAF